MENNKTIRNGLCQHFPFAEYRRDGNSSLLGNFRKFQTAATTLYSLATGCGRKERQANFPNPCASAYCEVSRRWTRRMASLSSAFPAKRFRLFATNERRRILRMLSASEETYGQRNFYPLRHFRLYSRISRISRLLLSTDSLDQFEVATSLIWSTRKEVLTN